MKNGVKESLKEMHLHKQMSVKVPVEKGINVHFSWTVILICYMDKVFVGREGFFRIWEEHFFPLLSEYGCETFH